MDLPSLADPLHPVAAAVDRARRLYRPDVRWSAPRRGLVVDGRDALVAHLLAEAGAMREPELRPIRRAASGATRVVEESVIRFVYAGAGIAGLCATMDERVELGRVRIVDFDAAGAIAVETCIETWSVLPAIPPAQTPAAPSGAATADGSSGDPRMAPRERFAPGG